MRRYLSALGLVALLAEPSSARTLIRGVTVVDGTGAPARRMSVVIDGDRISAVRPLDPPRGTIMDVVDGTGLFLIPGLWDMHVHLTTTPEQDVSRALLPLLLRYGVVGVRDMGGDPARLEELKREVASGKPGPIIATPGPFVDGPQEASPMVVQVKTDEEARAAVRDLAKRRVDFIKVQSGLTLASWRAVIDEAPRVGLGVAGHVPEAVSAWDVVRSSQRSIEHISPAIPGDAGLLLACSTDEETLRDEIVALSHTEKEPSVDRTAIRAARRAVQKRLLDTLDPAKSDRMASLLAEHGTAVVPTLVFSRAFAPVDEAVEPDVPLDAVPSAMRAHWEAVRKAYMESSTPEDLAFRRRMDEVSRTFVARLHRAGVKLLAGTDALDAFVVPGHALHQELALLVSCRLTPMEALQAATSGATRFLGRDRDYGTIEVGKRADLVLLAGDPLKDIRNTRRIVAVWQAGRVVSGVPPREAAPAPARAGR
jgi:imidazolonepropionase-like amidohydrolase